jgi:hypothetical protein
MTTTIVLAEDSFIVREGVRMLLGDAGYDLQASVEDYDELMAAVAERRRLIDSKTERAVSTESCCPPRPETRTSARSRELPHRR